MFKFLFGKSNPTRNWPPNGDAVLTLDLDAASLNGIEVGEPLEQLSFLGPDEDRSSFKSGEFRYYSQGLCVECMGSDDEITAYHILFHDQDETQYQRFRGSLTRAGQPLDLAPLTVGRCAQALGDYYWIDEDEDESIVFYEFPEREWQLEFDLDGALKRLIVTNRPVMADAFQRESYEVTKPWPPVY